MTRGKKEKYDILGHSCLNVCVCEGARRVGVGECCGATE